MVMLIGGLGDGAPACAVCYPEILFRKKEEAEAFWLKSSNLSLVGAYFEPILIYTDSSWFGEVSTSDSPCIYNIFVVYCV